MPRASRRHAAILSPQSGLTCFGAGPYKHADPKTRRMLRESLDCGHGSGAGDIAAIIHQICSIIDRGSLRAAIHLYSEGRGWRFGCTKTPFPVNLIGTSIVVLTLEVSSARRDRIIHHEFLRCGRRVSHFEGVDKDVSRTRLSLVHLLPEPRVWEFQTWIIPQDPSLAWLSTATFRPYCTPASPGLPEPRMVSPRSIP